MKGGEMTEERKEELRQLLNEAMENLEMVSRFTYPPMPSIDIDKYKWHLREAWTSYSPNSAWFVNHYKIDTTEDTKSKLLNFIKTELDPFINEDRILLGTFIVLDGLESGVHLNDFLEKLLKIAIFGGIEEGVSAFDRCLTKDASVSFEFIALLEGVTLEAEVEVFKGIRLVPLPSTGIVGHLPRCLGSLSPTNSSRFFKKTLLTIEYSISPLFSKPYIQTDTDVKNTADEYHKIRKNFLVEVKGGKFPEYANTVFTIFHQKFCQALSLACNSGVKYAMDWNFLAEDELLNINPNQARWVGWYPGPFGDFIKVGDTQIEEAKRLYKILVDTTSNTTSEIGKELQTAINRWVQSKTNKNDVDKMIDLGVAFESIYLPKNKTDQLAFQFRLRASWHLGKNKAERRKLIDEFDAIYTLRSQAVHNGELSPTVKIRKGNQNKLGESVPTSEFLPRAQELCRASIIKILKDGEFPDDAYWKDLILG